MNRRAMNPQPFQPAAKAAPRPALRPLPPSAGGGAARGILLAILLSAAFWAALGLGLSAG
jgi:hypothetical protein